MGSNFWPGRFEFGARLALLAALAAGFTWLMAGSPGHPARNWREGQVAPSTIYAPWDFTVEDQNPPVQVQKGELLVSRGERLTPLHVARLSALDRAQILEKTELPWAGAFLLSWLFTAAGAIYIKRFEKQVWASQRQLALIAAVIGLILGVSRLVLISPVIPPWAPVASVAMLLSMLLNPRLGILLGLLTTGMVILMGRSDLPLVIGLSAGCFMGAYVVQGIRRRIDFFRAGLITGLGAGAALLGGRLLLGSSIAEALTDAAAGVGSGVLSGLITFCLLPLCESLFGLITDVSLVELADLNHPLLKELSVKAPGTYHHSLIVANLAEAACEAIGANALLARVGCYFHDIGKMLHPEYFIENQLPKTSRHDHLSASMSSLVILNHVKEGMELARKAKLNPAIIDFIPGHHGTGIIYYFYRRAMEEAEDQADLKEDRFRYPGPKPHARETAVALLSDSVEAATRTLSQKTPARIQEVVRRILNNKFVDGQLDECDLTLRDLNRIAEAFQRVLAGIYHSRIEYPKAPEEEELPPPVADVG